MEATLFDGTTADRHRVEIEAGPGALIVARRGIESERIDAGDLTLIDRAANRTTVGHRDRAGWRLVLTHPIDETVAAVLPSANIYGRWIDRVGLWKATGAFAAVAGAVLLVGYTAPSWLAPLVPESWERNLGTALVGDFGDVACRNPNADIALRKMARRVEPVAANRAAIPMTVLNVGIFNAAAIPGNQIVIFEGALDDVDNPDAMAGILAHEIGHVRKRHVTQALIRELGIGALVRLFAGNIGANAQQLVSLSYTRTNEEEADRDAIAALEKAGIDPRPTGALFRKLSKDAGGMDSVKWLNSHPRSADRAKLFDASYRKERVYTPSLASLDYDALRAACLGANRKKDGKD